MFLCGSTAVAQVVDEDQEVTNRDSFYEVQNSNKAKKPFVYPYVRSADVVWQHRVWRVVDFREKMNQPFYYPQGDEGLQGRVNLFNVLDKAIKDGTIKVYADDEFTTEVDYAKLLESAGDKKLETKYRYNVDNMEEEYEEETYIAMNPMDVKSMRIKEDWYIDKQRSVRDVRIIGFSLIYMKARGEGEPAQPYPLGWICYNEPEVRNLLANAEMYNPKNDVERRSFDDVFVKRMFTSYIIRESNVPNRSVSEYLTGMDALFESQSIEEELFNMEQDMWEY